MFTQAVGMQHATGNDNAVIIVGIRSSDQGVDPKPDSPVLALPTFNLPFPAGYQIGRHSVFFQRITHIGELSLINAIVRQNGDLPVAYQNVFVLEVRADAHSMSLKICCRASNIYMIFIMETLDAGQSYVVTKRISLKRKEYYYEKAAGSL